MGAYDLTRWEDCLYVSAPVWMQSRFENDLPADGQIWGFPQDIPGAVVQFPQTDRWDARYYITFDHMSRVWSAREKIFMVSEAKLLELVEKREYVRYERT